jgi:uncharacterized iron-regulated membrane protein
MNMSTAAVYRTIWRWHFYAGLFVIPFVVVLALSGTFFLFKPQIERWEERSFQQLPTANAVPASKQVAAALTAIPGASFHSYRLPEREGDAAMVHVSLPTHSANTDVPMRDVFVSPQGAVLGSLDPESRVMAIIHRVHGQLLLGPRGSWLVELAASWTIVMLVTGLYLWWPRGRGMAGVVWPRRGTPLRDLHAVTGFWVSGFALVLLLTGLPWADVWGSAFTAVRTEMGWVKGAQDWTIGGRVVASNEHAAHDHGAMLAAGPAPSAVSLDTIVAHAAAEALAFPAVVVAPGAAQRWEASAAGQWTVKSDAQNRPLRMTIRYDASTGAEVSREGFGERHPIDKVIGYGIAWHEGALFGVINQIVGVATTLALLTLSVAGFMMWRHRRPAGVLGAPPLPADRRKPLFVVIATLALALFLPLLAASLLLLWLLDLALPRLSPAAAAWLGITPNSRTLTP